MNIFINTNNQRFLLRSKLLFFFLATILQALSIAFDHSLNLYAQSKDKERSITRSNVDLIKTVAIGRTFIWGTEAIDSDRHSNGWSDSVTIRMVNALPEGAEFYGGMIADNLTRTFKGIGQIRFTPSQKQIGKEIFFNFELMGQHQAGDLFTLKVKVLSTPEIDDYKTVTVGHTLRYVWHQTIPVLNRLDSLGWKDKIGIKLIDPIPNNTKFYSSVFLDSTKRNNKFTCQIVFTSTKAQTKEEVLFNFESTGQFGNREWHTLKVKVLETPKIHQEKTVYTGEAVKFGIRRIVPGYETSGWPQKIDIRVIEPIPEGAKFYKIMIPDKSTQTIDARGEIFFIPLPEHLDKEFLFTFEITSHRETYWHTVKVKVVSKIQEALKRN